MNQPGVSLRELIFNRAIEGDAAAQDCLLMALPDPLPAYAVAKYRDTRIAEAARWLRAIVPGATVYRTSRMIASAGATLECRSTLALVPETASLTTSELASLARLVMPLLSPDKPWPGERRIRMIVAESWKLYPLEISNPVDGSMVD